MRPDFHHIALAYDMGIGRSLHFCFVNLILPTLARGSAEDIESEVLFCVQSQEAMMLGPNGACLQSEEDRSLSRYI